MRCCVKDLAHKSCVLFDWRGLAQTSGKALPLQRFAHLPIRMAGQATPNKQAGAAESPAAGEGRKGREDC